MSYILSALRKAEQERRDFAPAEGARPLVTEPTIQQPGQNRSWLVVGIVTVVAMLLAGGYLLGSAKMGQPSVDTAELAIDGQTSIITKRVERETEVVPAQPPGSDSSKDGGAVQYDTDQNTVHNLPEGKTEQPLPPVAESAQPVSPVTPLPVINITGYIFFEDQPESSKLFVDGIVYRLHSRLASGMTIREFRKDAVIVNYRGSRQEIRIP